MPATTVMQGGVLPLEKIADLPGVIKKLTSGSRPSSEQIVFDDSLWLDSTLFLSGILRSFNQVRYTIASSRSTTVITHPATSRNVATIRWPTNISGEALIETQDLTLTLKKWLSRSSMGPNLACTFQKYGNTPSIKWTHKDGEWEATDPKKQVLAIFVSRRSAIGTRIDLTSVGLAHADALVLTALLTVTGQHDWRLYSSIRDHTAGIIENPTENPDEQSPMESDRPDAALPSYRQAPFTRPVGPLLRASSDTTTDDVASSDPAETIDGTPPTLPPLTLEFSSRQLLHGIFSEQTRARVSITTRGPYTTISLHQPKSDPVVREEGSIPFQTAKVGLIEWAPPRAPADAVRIE